MFIEEHFCTTAKLPQKEPGLEESPENENLSKKRKYYLKVPRQAIFPPTYAMSLRKV